MEVISSDYNLNDSLKQALINSAMSVFDEFVEEKSEDIANKYKDDPRYIKARELFKESKQISTRLYEIKNELDSIFPFTCSWVSTDNSSRYILNRLAGITDIRTKLDNKIRDHIEIEVSTPCFDPRHILNELNEMARKAISKINI